MSRSKPAIDAAATLQVAIDQVLLEMQTVTADSPEFAKLTDQLVILTKALPNKEPKVKMDTLLTVGGNLAGILLILNFEKANVIATKALGFVGKFR